MKKELSLSLATALLFSLFFAGCKKDTAVSATSQLSFDMLSDNASANLSAFTNNTGLTLNSTPLGTASVTWTTAIANVTKFKLDAKQGGVPFEVTANGLSNIDLFAITPASISAVIPVGTYTGVELHVVLAKSTGTAFPLVLKGNYTTKAGNVVPIEFDFNEDVEIVATAADLVVDGKSDVLANISLHLNKLIANITTTDIDQTARTNSTILITGAINPTVYNKIKTDLQLSGGSNIVTTVKK